MNALSGERKGSLRLLLALASGFGMFLAAGILAGQEFDQLIAPGKLSRAHAHLAGIGNCGQCHTKKKKADPMKCLACHRDLAERIKAGRGWHRNKIDGCIACHPEHQGEDFNLIEWDPKKFAHDQSGFPLKGRHRQISDCAACHSKANALPGKKGRSYLLKSAACASCHADPHRGQLGGQCSRCHTTDVPFKQVAFDHGKTRFPLQGAHKGLACAACHPDQRWQVPAFSRCSDCHRDPHQPSQGKNCRSCHQETSWKSARFDHERTRFPLRGKHSALACAQCHPRGVKAAKPAFGKCSDCHHRDPHQGRFAGDCGDCHTVDGFAKTVFDHNTTRFPLTGKHASLSCRQCHPQAAGAKAAVYAKRSTACADCHADVHLGQFAAACDTCHTTAGFGGSALKFDRQGHSTFPLQGKHATLACGECHLKVSMAFPAGKGEAVRYKPLSGACRDCHGDYHQGQLGQDCRQCHGFDSFRSAPGFDHQRTQFSLRPFHERVGCRRCHPLATMTVNGQKVRTVQYKNISSECRECHRQFDHSRTSFPLIGVHGELDCRKCHNERTPNIRGSAVAGQGGAECTACHRSPHLGQQRNCRECHNGRNWRVDQW